MKFDSVFINVFDDSYKVILNLRFTLQCPTTGCRLEHNRCGHEPTLSCYQASCSKEFLPQANRFWFLCCCWLICFEQRGKLNTIRIMMPFQYLRHLVSSVAKHYGVIAIFLEGNLKRHLLVLINLWR